ncbi:hypothetical protein [Bdellovibrio sp.]|uniref:hypothetical protein n=1 Tax=Bdellovibrio sp. TaxID=28201 RepID=UPI0039E3D8A8
MVDINLLVSILWRPFVEQAKTGDPIFFCFHAEMLVDLFRDARIPYDNPVRLINDVANSLIRIDDGDVEIDQSAFKRNKSGFSCAIILVCQQVLVVEDMVRDPAGFSEKAYFPRLRARIGLPEKSLNPFTFDDFERVWRQLSLELTSLPGASPKSITFSFGIESGINKARSFPMSQALLSRDDLLVLVQKIGINNAKSSTHESLWGSIRQGRVFLRRRAQRLIGFQILRDRIVDQVRHFLLTVDLSKLQQLKMDRKIGEIAGVGFFKEPIDWTSEEYRMFIHSNSSNQRIFDESEIALEFEEAIRKKGFLVLPPEQTGDVWVKRRQVDLIAPGSMFLIIGSKLEIRRAFELIGKFWPAFTCDKSEEYVLSGRSIEWVVEVYWPKEMPDDLMIYDGALSADQRLESARRYDWIGGICLNKIHNRFLRNYLPTKVKFGDLEFSIEECKKINDRVISIQSILSEAGEATEDMLLELHFGEDRVAKISIAHNIMSEGDWMGYKMVKSGCLAPVLDRVDAVDSALIGFNLPFDSSKSFSVIQISALIKGLYPSDGVTLSGKQLDHIERRLEASIAPRELVSYLQRTIRLKPLLEIETIELLDISY